MCDDEIEIVSLFTHRVDGVCVFDRERADALALQRFEATTDTEFRPQISNQRPNIRTAATAHFEIDRWPFVLVNANPVDADSARPQLQCFPASTQLVGGDSANLHRTTLGWNLRNVALECGAGLDYFFLRRHARAFHRDSLTLHVVSDVGHVEPGSCAIHLGLIHDQLDKFGRLAKTNKQDAGGSWIERSAVTTFSLVSDGADLIDGTSRRQSKRFVEIDDAGQRVDVDLANWSMHGTYAIHAR